MGEEVKKSLKPGEVFVKIVKDELVDLLGKEDEPLIVVKPMTILMMCGLQGSGKTTTTGKLDLPNNLKTIDNCAFHWNNITEVNIPSSVTTLGGGTFSYNNITGANVYIYGRKSDGSIDYTKLDSYGGKDASGTTLPSTVTYIGNAAYMHVTLPSFEIPSRVTYIGNYMLSLLVFHFKAYHYQA